MNMVITVSREFGSGGRELGKRLADVLGLRYVDKEIVTKISEESGVSEDYVKSILDGGVKKSFNITFSRSFAYMATSIAPAILAQHHKTVKEIAQDGNCVIVGSYGEAALKDMPHFRIFVYADTDHKVKRCLDHAREGESLNPKDMEKKILQIDKLRAKDHEFISDRRWGEKSGYDLCVNTTGKEIKDIVGPVAEYIKAWYGDRG